jgi:hypothetical protein
MASDPKQPSTNLSPEALKLMPPEQLAALAAQGKEIQGPVANAGGAIVIQAANDAMLIFNRPHPLIINGQFANIATSETVAIIHMSLATLKDLHIAIGEAIEIYEKTHDKIVTDTMKQRAADKK